MAGFYDSGDRDLDNVTSGWRPIQVRASPFGDHSEEFVDSDNAVQIFDTPPHSCSEDEQQPRIVRQKSGIHAPDGPGMFPIVWFPFCPQSPLRVPFNAGIHGFIITYALLCQVQLDAIL